MAYPPPPPPGPTYEHATHEKASHIPGFSAPDQEDDLPSVISGQGENLSYVPPSAYGYGYGRSGYGYGGYPSSSGYSAQDQFAAPQNMNQNPNNNCCWNACYDPCNLKQLFQSPCQIGVIPMRSAAFQAPRIPLPKLCDHLLTQCCDDDEDEEDGVAFQFKPQKNCRTEVTFTIEPRTQPPWLTMMNCGFKPLVNCSAPPCYLSNDGNPGIDYLGGTQSFVNKSFGSQVSYGGMANFPTLDQLSESLAGSKIKGLKKADGSAFAEDKAEETKPTADETPTDKKEDAEQTQEGAATTAAVTTPEAGTLAAGTTPEAKTTPAAGTTTEAKTTPAAGTTPEAKTTPAAGTTPEAKAKPAAGTTPEVKATPAAETTPEAKTKPAAGTTPQEKATPADAIKPAAATTHQSHRGSLQNKDAFGRGRHEGEMGTAAAGGTRKESKPHSTAGGHQRDYRKSIGPGRDHHSHHSAHHSQHPDKPVHESEKQQPPEAGKDEQAQAQAHHRTIDSGSDLSRSDDWHP